MTCPICGYKESEKGRSLMQLRLYWTMLRLVCDYAETEAFRGNDGPHNLHEALKMAMGYSRPVYGLSGKISGYKPESIAFHKMPHEKFTAFFDKAQGFIFTNVLPHINREDFEREFCNLLKMPTIEDYF